MNDAPIHRNRSAGALSSRSGRLAALLAVFALGGVSCTYRVAVRPAPSREAYAFDGRLPARAAIFVDGEQLYRDVQMFSSDGEHCAGSQYPLDARNALGPSVLGTLEPLVDEVRLTATRIGREELERMELDAVIAVRAEVFDASIAASSFLRMEAAIGLSLAVSVFTGDGLQFRETVMGNAVQTGSGLSCGTGADLLADAAEIAIRNAMTDLGELVVNAPGLREALGGSRQS